MSRSRSKRSDATGFDGHHADRWRAFMNLYTLIDRKLGDGAFGKVVMAIDCFRQRQTACKIVALKNPALLRAQKPAFGNRLRREADLLKDLSYIRAVVEALGSGCG